MAPLSERQLQAQAIAGELAKLGAWCISPLPLDDSQPLRWQVLDSDRDAVLEKVGSWGWSAVMRGSIPRFCPSGPLQSSVYEIDLPKPRQVVVDTRIVPRGEVVEQERRKSAAELKAMRKHLGLI